MDPKCKRLNQQLDIFDNIYGVNLITLLEYIYYINFAFEIVNIMLYPD